MWRSPISADLNQFEWFDGIAGLDETVAVARVDQRLTLIDIDLQFIGRHLVRRQLTSYRNRGGAALWQPLRDRRGITPGESKPPLSA